MQITGAHTQCHTQVNGNILCTSVNGYGKRKLIPTEYYDIVFMGEVDTCRVG